MASTTLTVRLDSETRRAVEEQAASEGLSVSEYVRRILEDIAPEAPAGDAGEEREEERAAHVHHWRPLRPGDPREARAVAAGYSRLCEECREVGR